MKIKHNTKYIFFGFAIALFILLLYLFKNISTQESTLSHFSGKKQDKYKSINQSSEFTMISTGDIGLVRDVNYRIQQKNDPNYPFLHIAEYLRNADLTVINLEGPLISNCPIVITGFKFCGDLSNVSGLKYAGIDAANLANNHTTNYGLDGMRQTVQNLQQVGIVPYGLEGKIEYKIVKNHNISFVGFVELENNWAGLNNATVDNISTLVHRARKTSDIVIVSFHWGVEYTHQPTSEMIKLGRYAIDAGADIVLGNHPHWIQIKERYKDKYIIYAQGNTIFDQDWSQQTREGVLYKFLYKDLGFELIDERYTIIEDNAQPRFATDEEANIIKNKIR